MRVVYLLLPFIFVCVAAVRKITLPKFENVYTNYTYDVKYFASKIDHFSFTTDNTFYMKYLINNKSFTPNGPIFFYTGNEGAIELFADNSGFIWELAVQHGATVIFAEHRFYGDSKPFGNMSFSDVKHFGYLTAEQALADYALLISSLKINHTAYELSPVIAFGGSYGGMLSAWFRQKYPNVVAGAVAASAPILLFPGLSDCNGFSMVTTSTFLKYGGTNCVQNIRRGWRSISNIASTTDGKELLFSLFHTCANDFSVENLMDYVKDFLFTIAMVNYPYQADFIGSLPAWPVRFMCTSLSGYDPSQSDVITAQLIANAVLSLANYTGQLKCLDFADNTSGLDALGWDVQTCMEMVTPICAFGDNNMFPVSKWDFTTFIDECRNKYNVIPRVNWSEVHFGGKHIRTVSNIIFSNGKLDPWSAFSVLDQSVVPHATVINIEDAAHHLDLRPSNPSDPPSIKNVREMENRKIADWITEWHVFYPT